MVQFSGVRPSLLAMTFSFRFPPPSTGLGSKYIKKKEYPISNKEFRIRTNFIYFLDRIFCFYYDGGLKPDNRILGDTKE